MDTIFYLYIIKKEQTSVSGAADQIPPVFTLRRQEREGYRMIFTGLPSGLLGQADQRPDRLPEGAAQGVAPGGRKGRRTGTGGWGLASKPLKPDKKSWLQGRAYRKKQKEQERQRLEQEKQKLEQEKQRQEQVRRRTAWILELQAYLRPYVEEYPACYCVCEEAVERWLKKEELWGWWQENRTICGMDGYHQQCFAEELLKQVHLAHYLILGFDDSVPELLRERACHMKSLRLVLDREPEELEGFLEELYEEAGLTAAVQLVERRADRPDSPYYGCRIVCPLPSVILDYSREPHLITVDVARGSLWLDMDALETKRRRIEDRNTGILYFSMKKEWKRAART